MPHNTVKYKDNTMYKQLKKNFGSMLEASKQLGFCEKTIWLWIAGNSITDSAKRRIRIAGYSPVTFKKK